MPGRAFNNVGSTYDTFVKVVAILNLAAADYIEVEVRQDSGAALTINPQGSSQVTPFFKVQKLT